MYNNLKNVIKYPSPEAKASPSPSRGEGSRLLRCYTPRNDAVTNGEGVLHHWCYKILGTRPRMTGGRGAGFVGLLRRCTPRNDVSNVGRSMIEMLGVLAIIGVLSVGGIAGYSKAMEMWKINKAIEGYSYMTQGLMEHIDNLRTILPNTVDNKYYLAETIKNLNLIPEGWSRIGNSLYDNAGSYVMVFSRRNNLVYDISLGVISDTDNSKISSSFSNKLCQKFMTNFVQPLHSSLQYAFIFKSKSTSIFYYGDSQCTNGRKCLINTTLSDIQNDCNSCLIGNDLCLLTLEF